MSGKTIIFLVLFSLSAITAEIEHAKKYYASREYEKAYRIFRELAEQGNCNAPRLSRAALRISGQKTHKKFFESP